MGRRKSGKYFTLSDAAAQGHLVRVRCSGCNRAMNYLPEDLATEYGASRPALIPLFDCSRCRTDIHMRVTTYDPGIADFGRITVRRPGPLRTIRTWRSETFTERTRVDYVQEGDYGF